MAEVKKGMYQTFLPPTPEEPVRLHDYPPFDVRHGQDAPPMPWLRYMFPRDFDLREGDEQIGPYHQYFDVQLAPVQEDSGIPPPPWAPNAFFRLSFTQGKYDPDKKVDVPGRTPDLTSPLIQAAQDVTHGNVQLYEEAAQTYLQEVLAFCRQCCSFKPRIWRDAVPLVDLLRGVLLYLITQTEAGVQLARDYALRDALAAQEADRAAVRAAAAEELARMRAAWDQEAAAQAAAQKEALRKQLADDLQSQLRNLNEERERWAQKAAAGDAAIKKLTESEGALERRVAQLEAQLDTERAEGARALTARIQEVKQAQKDAVACQDALLKARGCILQALKSKSKPELVATALEAIRTTLPGTSAYVADLRQSAAALTALGGEVSASMSALRQAAQVEGAGSPLATILDGLTPDFLGSPLSAGVVTATGPASSFDDAGDDMQLQYVAASAGQEFVVGQSLSRQEGVSWDAVQSGQFLHVLDVMQERRVKFLRPGGTPAGGSFLAVPILGMDKEVVGLLGLDTVQGGAGTTGGMLQLGADDAAFVQQLAAIISTAVAKEQQTVATLVDQMTVTDDAGMHGGVSVDPERYADGDGGKQLLKVAITALRDLTEEELDTFRNMESPSSTLLALLRTVLRAAGQVDDTQWSNMRGLITRELLERIAGLDPEAAWAEWQQWVSSLQPLLEAEQLAELPMDVLLAEEAHAAPQEDAGLSNSVGRALGRWVVAVRKISAARELEREAEARLARANAALLRALSNGQEGEGGAAHALQELRSYRIPPKYTFTVMQAVLRLLGQSDEDCQHWGRMKVLTTIRMIKQLTELKPSSIGKKVFTGLRRSLNELDDADVRKESTAALALFHWLQQFLRCAEVSRA